jgi:hypothetical protein
METRFPFFRVSHEALILASSHTTTTTLLPCEHSNGTTGSRDQLVPGRWIYSISVALTFTLKSSTLTLAINLLPSPLPRSTLFYAHYRDQFLRYVPSPPPHHFPPVFIPHPPSYHIIVELLTSNRNHRQHARLRHYGSQSAPHLPRKRY